MKIVILQFVVFTNYPSFNCSSMKHLLFNMKKINIIFLTTVNLNCFIIGYFIQIFICKRIIIYFLPPYLFYHLKICQSHSHCLIEWLSFNFFNLKWYVFYLLNFHVEIYSVCFSAEFSFFVLSLLAYFL